MTTADMMLTDKWNAWLHAFCKFLESDGHRQLTHDERVRLAHVLESVHNATQHLNYYESAEKKTYAAVEFILSCNIGCALKWYTRLAHEGKLQWQQIG